MAEKIVAYNFLVESVYMLLLKISQSVSHVKNVIVEKKSIADFVTNIDFGVEQTLIRGLKEIDDIPCLAEETSPLVDCHDYWVIDPIDGTTNLIHEYPSYCVSIAKIQNGITEYAFVYNLATKELFIAVRNQGAYLVNTRTARQKKICVSDIYSLSDSLIGFGCPYDKTKIDNILMVSNNVLRQCHDLKRNGPSSLDICFVASGRLDGYYEYDLKEWDYKAAQLILEEAGGKITNWRGENVLAGTNHIVASNGKVHGQILKCLNYGN